MYPGSSTAFLLSSLQPRNCQAQILDIQRNCNFIEPFDGCYTQQPINEAVLLTLKPQYFLVGLKKRLASKITTPVLCSAQLSIQRLSGALSQEIKQIKNAWKYSSSTHKISSHGA
jgi:hypothetical protein